MPIEQTQPDMPIQGDDLRAALGFSNNILSQTLPQDAPQASVEAPEPQGEEIEPEVKETSQEEQEEEKPEIDKYKAEIDSMKTDIDLLKKLVLKNQNLND